MWELLSQPSTRAFMAVVVLLVVVYAGVWVLKGLRPSTSKADTSAYGLAQKFQEMQHEGDIDGSELRKIKAVLERTQDTRLGQWFRCLACGH